MKKKAMKRKTHPKGLRSSLRRRMKRVRLQRRQQIKTRKTRKNQRRKSRSVRRKMLIASQTRDQGHNSLMMLTKETISQKALRML